MTQVINHRLPLRPGCIVEVELPVDLNQVEAAWLKGWIEGLAQLNSPSPCPVTMPLPRPDEEDTLEHLESFLTRAQQAGQLSSDRAMVLRSAVRRVLETFPPLVRTPAPNVNVGAVIEAFANVRRSDYTEITIRQYTERFRAALRHYRAWVGPRHARQLLAGRILLISYVRSCQS